MRRVPMLPRLTAPLALAFTLGFATPLPQLGGTAALAQSQLASGLQMQRLALGMGMSVPVDLPRDARDVIVANPKIANVVIRSARKAFVIGNEPGQTNIFFLDADGREIAGLALNVGRDLTHLRTTLRQMQPNSDIRIETAQDSVILYGTVATPLDAQQVVDVATKLIGDEKKVVNAMTIRGKDQVHLKVTVAEIQRTAIKQLGISLGAFDPTGAVSGPAGNLSNSGGILFGMLSDARFNVNGTSPSNSVVLGGQFGSAYGTGTVKALEENGLFRTLAEPTLTAISGEQAKFLAGGEFPVPTGRDTQGNILIEFKPFGVSLGFTPVVLSENRISLRVGTEVSEISNEVTLRLTGLTVPGLRIRRADTTVELPSGGSMVIAGLLQDQTRQAVSGTPGLMNIPILGTLFRSRDYQRGQTELVVIVTPYMVRPVSSNKLVRPDENYRDTTDVQAILSGKLSRAHDPARTGGAPGTQFHGTYGFNRD